MQTRGNTAVAELMLPHLAQTFSDVLLVRVEVCSIGAIYREFFRFAIYTSNSKSLIIRLLEGLSNFNKCWRVMGPPAAFKIAIQLKVCNRPLPCPTFRRWWQQSRW